MAKKTTDARAVSARERARERAAHFRAREARLEELGVSYFAADDQVQRVNAIRDREIAAAEERARRGSAAAFATADQVIREMLELGVTRAEVIERLGASPAELRRALAVRAGGGERDHDHDHDHDHDEADNGRGKNANASAEERDDVTASPAEADRERDDGAARDDEQSEVPAA
ncbi:hypothetical protein [Leifsonia aquatica]|uniref:hypothetical protein n=1 Tax=Leifsonia aquatica TaxID=144185 RepID=UPI00382DF28B